MTPTGPSDGQESALPPTDAADLALECSGHGVDIEHALATLAGAVAAASGR